MASSGDDRAGASIRENFDAAAALLTDPRDKALLKELVYGTLRRQIPLDDLLTRASGHKVFRVDPKLAPILRVADALDRGHVQRIRNPCIAFEPRRMIIAPERCGDLTLEQFALREKGQMFEQVYGMEVSLRAAG